MPSTNPQTRYSLSYSSHVAYMRGFECIATRGFIFPHGTKSVGYVSIVKTLRLY